MTLPDEQRPLVVVPMGPVPDGVMPRGVRLVVAAALEHGLSVRSTYAVAFVPGVLRRLKGSGKAVDGEAAARGEKSERYTATDETIAVRIWREGAVAGVVPVVGPERGYAIWRRRDGGSWVASSAMLRRSGCWPASVGVKALGEWINAFSA